MGSLYFRNRKSNNVLQILKISKIVLVNTQTEENMRPLWIFYNFTKRSLAIF